MAWLWTAAAAEVLLEHLIRGIRVHLEVLTEYILEASLTA